ncbi:MAG: hypothetical protein ACI9F9_000071 [Candidatus Paceibacteria bacterium]|jgi:hypothetical protein
MRVLLSLLCLLSFGISSAQAQVVAIQFKDAKEAKKFKNNMVEFRGEMVVIGEPMSGIRYIAETNTLQYDSQNANELFVVDPKKPEKHAYFLVDGEKQLASKKNRVSIQGGQIAGVTMVMRDQSLPGLTTEYNSRREQVEIYRVERDALEDGTTLWLASHHRVVTSLERYRGWCESVGFTGVLKSLDKEIKKEKKQVRDAALATRAERAQESVASFDVPEELLRVSEEEYGGKHVFHAVASEHFRMYYLVDGNTGDEMTISDQEATRLLRLAERILDDFRAEFVDPYIAEDYEDTIPEQHIGTWLFTPSSNKVFARYVDEMYGYNQSPDASGEEAKGTILFGGFPAHYRFPWRLQSVDMRGIICHQMGHLLALLHYGGSRGMMDQDWLNEAVGNQISFQYLGRNNVNCLGVKEKPTYLKREVAKPGEKTVAVGRRAMYNEIALTQGSSIQKVAIKKLFELNDADLAKGWSFYDYLSRREGKAGQQWLRAAADASKKRSTFIDSWRSAAAEVLGVSEKEAFTSIEKRWREFAENGQLKAD